MDATHFFRLRLDSRDRNLIFMHPARVEVWSNRRAIALALAAFTVAGCRDSGPGPYDTAGIVGLCRDAITALTRPCRAFWLLPESGAVGTAVLVGDSARVRAFSDSGFTAASWAVGAGLSITSSTPTALWAKATLAGTYTVSATALGGRTASTTIVVVDSSAIVSLSTDPNRSETRRAGSVYLRLNLIDAAGRSVAGTAQWSASNTTLVTITPQSYDSFGTFMPGARVTMHGQGSVTLTATFRNLSANINLFITP